jgi:hypothetical protein
MMEAAGTSETSVNFYQTTRRYNPEDSHLLTVTRLFLALLKIPYQILVLDTTERGISGYEL